MIAGIGEAIYAVKMAKGGKGISTAIPPSSDSAYSLTCTNNIPGRIVGL
jgi:hypothetical protein